jgi:hypothetical protein
MQGIMWGVFALTIAMALLIVQAQKRLRTVALAKQSTVAGDFAIHLPEKWRPRPSGNKGGQILEAAEPGRDKRTLRIFRQALVRPESPVEFLSERFGIDLELREDESALEDLDRSVKSTRFGDYPGVIMSVSVSVPGHRQEGGRKEVYAAAVLPSNQAVAIELTGIGEAGESDFAVVDQVARAIKVQNQPALQDQGSSVALINGAGFTAPSSFRAVEARDPNVTSRRLWYAPAGDESHLDVQWASVELIPCFFAPSKSNGNYTPQSELLTMLLARDHNWRGSAIQQRPQNEWVADMPVNQSGSIFSTRAFVHADPSGNAVLAILRGPGEDLESYWSQIRSTLKFTQSTRLDDLARAGAAEITRLREIPLDGLLQHRDADWRIWVNTSSSPYMGWSHMQWIPKQIAATFERRLRWQDRPVYRVTDKWSASSDWNRIHSESTLQTMESPPTVSIHQSVEVLGDSISMETTGTRTRTSWKKPAPPNFIAGSILPHLLGKLSPTPMLLRTDQLPAYEAMAPDCPMLLIVRDATDAAPAKTTTQPARTITLEINGTGELSRWHLSPEGKVLSINFADTIQAHPSNQDEIKLHLASEPDLLQGLQ